MAAPGANDYTVTIATEAARPVAREAAAPPSVPEGRVTDGRFHWSWSDGTEATYDPQQCAVTYREARFCGLRFRQLLLTVTALRLLARGGLVLHAGALNEALLEQVKHPCHSEGRVCAIGSEWAISADAWLYPCFNWRVRGFNLRRVRIADVAGRMEELYPEMVDLKQEDLASCDEGHRLSRHHCGALALRLHGDVRAHVQGFCDQAHAEEDALRAVAAERGMAIEAPAVAPLRGPATP